MTTPNNAFPWYTEHRAAPPEKITLDLSRHLQRRITVGPVVIITDRPSVTLPVLRKRWMRLITEVERQYASTLEHRKKHSLRHELARLRACTFSVDALSFVHVHCIANYRVSAFFYRYRRDVLGTDEAQARAEMERIWHPEGVWPRFVSQ